MTAGGSGVASLRGVSLRYGETRAVDDVSLEIPANRMVGLIGPDGVGKSSLLALLAGARKMQDGEIRVLDGDMRDRRHRRAVCPRIAYMPQGLGCSATTRPSASGASPICCKAPDWRRSPSVLRASCPAA